MDTWIFRGNWEGSGYAALGERTNLESMEREGPAISKLLVPDHQNQWILPSKQCRWESQTSVVFGYLLLKWRGV